MTTIAKTIAAELTKQGLEFDDLGDCESILLMGESPTINLIELATAVTAAHATPNPNNKNFDELVIKDMARDLHYRKALNTIANHRDTPTSIGHIADAALQGTR